MNRTLVLTDNQGGFESQVKHAGPLGNHMELDDETVLNPLHIEQAPDHIDPSKLDTTPYAMSAASAKHLIAGTIREQGADLGGIAHTLDDLIHWTYRDAEIYPGDIESHGRQSPDMTDMLRVGENVLDDPGEYAASDSKYEADELREEMKKIMRRLGGFTPRGKHRNLVGETEIKIKPGHVNYLDLRNVNDVTDRTVQLFQLLREIYEVFKVADGQCMAVFDEAHHFLEDRQMIEWLATASRQLRNYNGALWLVSQSPSDFASTTGDSDEIEKLKDIIREQCSTIDFFQLNKMDQDTATEFDMGPKQRQFIVDESIAGENETADRTTAMTWFSDHPGWYHYEVRRGDYITAANSYKRSEHGDFDEYMEQLIAENGGDLNA